MCIYIYIQQGAHVTDFILSDNYSTCFGHHQHPFQERKITVTTASGNRCTVLLSAAIVEDSTIASDNSTV